MQMLLSLWNVGPTYNSAGVLECYAEIVLCPSRGSIIKTNNYTSPVLDLYFVLFTIPVFVLSATAT